MRCLKRQEEMQWEHLHCDDKDPVVISFSVWQLACAMLMILVSTLLCCDRQNDSIVPNKPLCF